MPKRKPSTQATLAERAAPSSKDARLARISGGIVRAWPLALFFLSFVASCGEPVIPGPPQAEVIAVEQFWVCEFGNPASPGCPDLFIPGCLNAAIDEARFNLATDVRVEITITDAVGVETCGDILSAAGAQVTDPDPANPQICILKQNDPNDPNNPTNPNNFVTLESNAACIETTLQFTFPNFELPFLSEIRIEYVALVE